MAKSIILDREMFEDRNAKIAEKKGIFDFGYAITVNAAQGSQWDHVVIKNNPDAGARMRTAGYIRRSRGRRNG